MHIQSFGCLGGAPGFPALGWMTPRMNPGPEKPPLLADEGFRWGLATHRARPFARLLGGKGQSPPGTRACPPAPRGKIGVSPGEGKSASSLFSKTRFCGLGPVPGNLLAGACRPDHPPRPGAPGVLKPLAPPRAWSPGKVVFLGPPLKKGTLKGPEMMETPGGDLLGGRRNGPPHEPRWASPTRLGRKGCHPKSPPRGS